MFALPTSDEHLVVCTVGWPLLSIPENISIDAQLVLLYNTQSDTCLPFNRLIVKIFNVFDWRNTWTGTATETRFSFSFISFSQTVYISIWSHLLYIKYILHVKACYLPSMIEILSSSPVTEASKLPLSLSLILVRNDQIFVNRMTDSSICISSHNYITSVKQIESRWFITIMPRCTRRITYCYVKTQTHLYALCMHFFIKPTTSFFCAYLSTIS